ncbi:unnamed protein product [Didymodactylos carnosus]|uniref:Fungal lipase-type domain-containing protein n=1 Tax=Didymodactylos carnosus TaxID=1234261 RepID=A0A8S2GA36_9BILA|nr:unnamed protein product [Didymodactylos carnosus]CAF4519953.1 unnamed protein product [Didymodactylos carnosus]
MVIHGAVATMLTINLLIDIRPIECKKCISCITFDSAFVCDELCGKKSDENYKSHFQFYINHYDIVPYLLSIVCQEGERALKGGVKQFEEYEKC